MKSVQYWIVFLLSFSLIALEIAWTRIFSAEFFYTFAFLILSLAILGLGLGALSLRYFRKHTTGISSGQLLNITGFTALIGPPLVFLINLDFTQSLLSAPTIIKLIMTIGVLGLPYFWGGMLLGRLFRELHTELNRLYMADLIGAGLGAGTVIWSMNLFGTPATVFWSVLPVLLAAFISSPRRAKMVPVLLFSGMIVLGLNSDILLETKREEPAQIIFKHWDAMSKLKVYDHGPEYRRLNIDNVANTGVIGFDGNWDRPDSLKFGFHIVEFLIGQFDSCTFLSLGAGGGQDVFQALQDGAAEIHAVEVNPQINDLLVSGELAEFSGFIYHDPRVQVITEDARVYVRRFRNKFDLIYSFSSNSYAALASGAFALAENYIFTKEAFEDYWRALTPDGFILMENHFYIPRVTSSVIAALRSMGIKNYADHIAVFELPNMRRKMILIARQPMSGDFPAAAYGIHDSTSQHFARLLYPVPEPDADNLIYRVISAGWESAQQDAPVDISPTYDDRPYIAQMGLWKNFSFDKLQKFRGYEDLLGFPLSKMIILLILAVVIVLILPLTILPYFFERNVLRPVPWLYFFAIGLAFMMVEIILIQKYTLFIGPSVYSLITILLTLLLASGVGSRFAFRIKPYIFFPAIFIWLLLDIYWFTGLIYQFDHFSLGARILLTTLFVFPLGFFMGMPFPYAGRLAGGNMDWAFAVNGAASVLGSTLIVLIAVSFGFTVALLTGVLFYFIAFALTHLKKAW